MTDAPRRACCDTSEPTSGWYSFSVCGDPDFDDFYCSATCFVGHQDGTGGCFADDEMMADLSDGDWS